MVTGEGFAARGCIFDRGKFRQIRVVVFAIELQLSDVVVAVIVIA